MNKRIEQFLNDIVVTEAAEFVGKYADIIPYWSEIVGFDQNNPAHYTTLDNHIINAMEFAPKNLIVKLALLFHDHGKLFTQTTDENGISHYYKHSLSSAEIFLQFAILHNLPVKLAQETLALIKHHTDYNIRPQQAVAKLGDLALLLGELMIADKKAHNPTAHADCIDVQWFTTVRNMLYSPTSITLGAPQLIILVGSPKSGKSTLSANLAVDTSSTIVSRDAVRTILGGDKNYFKEETKVTEICAKQLQQAFNKKQNIIVDNTHLKKAYRDQLRTQAYKYGYKVRFIIMETDYTTIFNRAQIDGFPLEVLFNMLLSYVPVQPCEY